MSPEMIEELREVEKVALRAHKRWKARRAMKIRAWACVGLGVAVGAGITAILLGITGVLL